MTEVARPNAPPVGSSAVGVPGGVPNVPQPTSPDDIIDLDSVPGQIGHAILRASDGTVIRHPTGGLSENDVGIVYRMVLEIGTILEREGLQRITVGFQSVSYAIVLANGCLYVVKKRSSS